MRNDDKFSTAYKEIDLIAGHIRKLESWLQNETSSTNTDNKEAIAALKKLSKKLRNFESELGALGWVITNDKHYQSNIGK